MARGHFWYYINNSEGQPVVGATVSLYVAGTTTPLYVYDAESGSAAINTIPQLTTDAKGFFEFWVADLSEVNGYVTGSKFTMVWSKIAEIDDGIIEYIDFNTPRALAMTTDALFTTTWTSSGGYYYYDVEHNLANEYPIAQLYNDTSKLMEPITIETMDLNTSRIWKADNPNSHITVIG